MMTKDIIRKVRRIVAEELNISNGDISPGDDIYDYGVDSLDLLNIQITLECEFDVTIMDDDMEKLTTVRKMARYIDKLTRGVDHD